MCTHLLCPHPVTSMLSVLVTCCMIAAAATTQLKSYVPLQFKSFPFSRLQGAFHQSVELLLLQLSNCAQWVAHEYAKCVVVIIIVNYIHLYLYTVQMYLCSVCEWFIVFFVFPISQRCNWFTALNFHHTNLLWFNLSVVS